MGSLSILLGVGTCTRGTHALRPLQAPRHASPRGRGRGKGSRGSRSLLLLLLLLPGAQRAQPGRKAAASGPGHGRAGQGTTGGSRRFPSTTNSLVPGGPSTPPCTGAQSCSGPSASGRGLPSPAPAGQPSTGTARSEARPAGQDGTGREPTRPGWWGGEGEEKTE